MRHVESLRDEEEEEVHFCELETGRNLSDNYEERRSLLDIMNYQEGRDEISNYQVGNKMRSHDDLKYCWEDSEGISYCQEGNNMGSVEDLIGYQVGRDGNSYCQVGNEMGSEDIIDCQEGNIEFPIFQVGRGMQVRLFESLRNSGASSDQQGVMTREN
jgi:hypothetical protein